AVMSGVVEKTGLRRKSILIVDDSQRVQIYLAGIAKAVGLDVVTAPSLKESMAICDRRAFEVAFVDKRLVDLDEQNSDGIALINHIAAKSEGTRLVLLTGHGKYKDAIEVVNKSGAGIMERQVESPEWEVK